MARSNRHREIAWLASLVAAWPSAAGAATAGDAASELARASAGAGSAPAAEAVLALALGTPGGAGPAIGGVVFVANPRNGLGGTIRFTTSAAADPALTVFGPEGTWEVPGTGLTSADGGTSHEAVILGLRPARAYAFLPMATDTGTGAVGVAPSIGRTTGPRPPAIPPFEVTVRDPARMEPGVTMFNLATNAFRGIVAADDAGELVWYLESQDIFAPTDVRRLANGNFLAISNDLPLNTAAVEFDALGRTVNVWRAEDLGADAFHHEISEMPNGNLVGLSTELRAVGGYPGDATYNVVGDVIVEFTREGSVVNEVHLHDVLDPYRVLADFELPFWQIRYGVEVRDWTHGNAVVYDPADDTYVYSSRHQDVVLKVTRSAPHELVWVIGEDAAVSTADDAWPFLDYALTDLGISHQHSPQLLPNGRILIYDNGNVRGITRVVEYQIDPVNGFATQTWQWFDPDYAPPLYAPSVGDADMLPGGTVLVCDGGIVPDLSAPFLGNYARIAEVTRDTSEKIFELIVRDESEELENRTSYRAERLPSLYPPE